jgi:hypothetical protein
VYAGLGRNDDAIAAGLRGIEVDRPSRDAVIRAIRQEDLARIYVMVKENDKAVELLDQILGAPAHFMSPQMIRLDPTWEPIRNYSTIRAWLDASD